jgi:diaminopimelate epimerase
MTGSGNDFIFFDARTASPGVLESPAIIARLCARGTGIGGDGVVFLINHQGADIGLRYYNADGSLASLCGNATLCTAKLAVLLGGVNASGFTIFTDVGVVPARIRDGLPEFDFPAIGDAQPHFDAIRRSPGELRLGYVTAGVPHVVIHVEDISSIDIIGRGRAVRNDPSLSQGANVNFVALESGGKWAIRTYERGVENETLACGTGTVAAAVLLRSWGEITDESKTSAQVQLRTKSGLILGVRLTEDDNRGWIPSLRGEGRLVFLGEVAI